MRRPALAGFRTVSGHRPDTVQAGLAFSLRGVLDPMGLLGLDGVSLMEYRVRLATTALASALLLTACTGRVVLPPDDGLQLDLEGLEAALLAVGPTASDGWVAVGESAQAYIRGDSAWTATSAPSGWQGAIRDVLAVGDRVFVAGDHMQFVPLGGATASIQTTTATAGTLSAIAGGPDAIFVAGFRDSGSGFALEVRDGVVEDVPLPAVLTATTPALYGAWTDASGTTHFVGAGGTAFRLQDGSAEIDATQTEQDLMDIDGGSNGAFAVGGTETAVALRFDGFVWKDISPEGAPPLAAVSAAGEGAWVCGDAGYVARYDGESWTALRFLNASFDCHSVHVSADLVVFVGENARSGEGFLASVARFSP